MSEFESRIPLRLPERLHGRDNETALILNAFERVSDRRSEVVFISGEPGIGKTALVERLRAPILEIKGFFISGKFEQNARHKPLSALIDALSSLAQQLATLDDEQLRAFWAQRINQRLNGNASVLVDMVPAMASVLGEQPAPMELDPEPARIRMQGVVLDTLRAISDGNRTLVVFLDDLQWADQTTLELEKILVTDEDSRIMLVGAYRSSEVGADHPLTKIIEEQRAGHEQHRLPLTEIALEPLTGFDVQSLLVEVLGAKRVQLRELAMICQDRTAGNPFHMLQFLLAMRDQGLLNFNRHKNCWEWDEDGIRHLPSTGNVVELLAIRISAIGEELRELLGEAACFGSRFPVRQLAEVCGVEFHELARVLNSALDEGFLVPHSDLHHRVAGSSVPDICRFVHDRVEEAAYCALPEADRLRTHLRIGWTLGKAATGLARDGLLLDAAGQLLLATSLLDTSTDRAAAASLMLEAARVARRMTAWTDVFRYADAGRRLLGDSAWTHSPAKIFRLTQLALEAGYFADKSLDLDQLLADGVSHAPENLQRAELYRIRCGQMVMRGDWQPALSLGLKSLKCCFPDITESLDVDQSALALLEKEVSHSLTSLGADAIAKLPTATDPRALFLFRAVPLVTFGAFPSGKLAMRSYLPLIGMRTALHYGLCPQAFCTLGAYAAMLGARGMFRDAGDLAWQIAQEPRLQAPDPLYAHGINVNTHRALHFRVSFNECARLLDEAHSSALTFGDPFIAGVCQLNSIPMRLASGHPLMETRAHLEQLREFNENRSFAIIGVTSPVYGAYLSALRQGTLDEMQRELLIARLPPAMRGQWLEFWFNELRLHAAFWLRDDEQFESCLNAANKTLPILMGFPQAIEYFYLEYHLLLLQQVGIEAGEREARMHRAKAAIGEAADSCEDNYGHLAHLVAAEEAWQAGDLSAARTRFERAIMLTSSSGNLPYQALANERLADLQAERGKPTVAQGLRDEAIRLYREWGCEARAAMLASST